MQFGILPHDESTINDFSQLIPAELAEYNDWADSVPLEEPDELEQRHNEAGKALFQFAKFKFDTLHPFSRPDSLTRRGHTLIARRKVTVEQSRNGVMGDWRELIERLFDEQVIIYSIDVDRQCNLRVRFTPHFSYMPFDDELDKLPHNAAFIKANWVEIIPIEPHLPDDGGRCGAA